MQRQPYKFNLKRNYISLCAFLGLNNAWPLHASETVTIEGSLRIIEENLSDTNFNVINDGSLIISGATANVGNDTSQHQVKNSSLTVERNGMLQGTVYGSDSAITINNANFRGLLGISAPSDGIGSVDIINSTIEGSIHSGTGNVNNKIVVDNSSIAFKRGYLFNIQSGGLLVYNSALNVEDFAALFLKDTSSVDLNNVEITAVSTTGSSLSTHGMLLDNNDFARIISSNITADGSGIRLVSAADNETRSKLSIWDSAIVSNESTAVDAYNTEIKAWGSTFTSKETGNKISCFNTAALDKTGCGGIALENSTLWLRSNSQVISNNYGILVAGGDNKIILEESGIQSEDAAFRVDAGNVQGQVTTISISDSMESAGTGIVSKNGVLLEALNQAEVTLEIVNSKIKGDITADKSSQVEVVLHQNSMLTGQLQGLEALEIRRNAGWTLKGDNDLQYLLLEGGEVMLNEISQGSAPERFNTLTLDTLNGVGTFHLYTDLAQLKGDSLKITREATGYFTLNIKNTGVEPATGDALKVVQGTEAVNALFTLNGGKVDAGVWQYGLIKENNNWYLSTGEVVNDEEQPGEGGNKPGDNEKEPEDDTNGTVPDRTTSASTDAVLAMASATRFVMQNEMQNLRQRKGDLHTLSQREGGVWGRYLNNTSRINAAMDASYRLRQNGVEFGGDTVFANADGALQLGVLASYASNSIMHQRGGTSKIDGYGVGLYASQFFDSGFYLDALVKVNRFSNELHTLMSDGGAVNGRYHQYGAGMALEVGKQWKDANNSWIEPYARVTALQTSSQDARLSNGMKASIERQQSVQGELGFSGGKTFTVNKTEISPYVKFAVAQEFDRSNNVTLNEAWRFNNNFSGATLHYGAGVDMNINRDASVYAEFASQHGRHHTTPLNGNIGLRFNF